jgi:hypothetical protein
MNISQNARTFDVALQLKDAGVVNATGAAQVGGATKVLHVGAGRYDAAAVIDVSAIDVTSGDESYQIEIQGSTAEDFSAGVVNLAILKLGDSTVTGESADSIPGRFELPFTNDHEGTLYPYLRAHHTIAGTTPSINYTAWLQASGAR